MKRLTKIVAVALAAGSLITLGGCGSTRSSRITTAANWNIRTYNDVERDYADYWQKHAEVATYDVSFEQGTNPTYSLDYNDGGTYTTRFYMQAEYDWNSADIPEAYRTDAKDAVYVFETELSVSGTFTLTSTGKQYNFTDSVKTVVKFRMSGDNLRPVYSFHDVESTTPASYRAVSVDSMYSEVKSQFTTYYNRDCTEATVITEPDEGEKSTQSTDISSKEDYSLFENFQLRAAARALTKTNGTSYTFNVFAPEDGGLHSVQAVCTGDYELDDENEGQKTIIDALDAAYPYIFVEGNSESEDEEARGYRYTSVTLSLNSSMSGQSDTYWYSTVENDDVNAARSVLLRVISPAAFSLGTMQYNLSSLTLEDLGA